MYLFLKKNCEVSCSTGWLSIRPGYPHIFLFLFLFSKIGLLCVALVVLELTL